MNQDYRDAFAALHVPGDPVLLYNIWDVGSAHAVVAGGARALATGSHAVAEANGYPDGDRAADIPDVIEQDRVAGLVQGGKTIAQVLVHLTPSLSNSFFLMVRP